MTLTLSGGTAVVTGAASGIGRASALALAARGCHLALADRDAAGLAATAEAAAAHGVRVTRHVLDVADAAAVAALPEAVLAAHDDVRVLLNAAGTSLLGRFEEVTLEEFRWLLEINFFGTVAVTKAFLPVLMRQPRAQIANISSIFGVIAPAEQTAYVASKFAVRGFSEALRHELEGTPVGVTVIHPGGVRTPIAVNARVPAALDREQAAARASRFTRLALRLPAEVAAESIVNAIARRKKRLLIGHDARAAELLQRATPAHYWVLMRRRFHALRHVGE